LTKEQMIVFGFVAAAFLAGWLTSFVIRRRSRPAPEPPLYVPPPGPPPRVEPVTAAARAATPPLVEEVGAALTSDAANDGMLSVVRENGAAALSELELDLADWGFTYGVAWARARERAPGGPDDAVAQEALEAAQRVFRAYTGGDDWTQRTHDGDAGPQSGSGPPG
jgi:hypothetical protein